MRECFVLFIFSIVIFIKLLSFVFWKKKKKVAKNIHLWTISHKSVKYLTLFGCRLQYYSIPLRHSLLFSQRSQRSISCYFFVLCKYHSYLILLHIFFWIERNFVFLFLWSQAQQIVSCCREKELKIFVDTEYATHLQLYKQDTVTCHWTTAVRHTENSDSSASDASHWLFTNWTWCQVNYSLNV